MPKRKVDTVRVEGPLAPYVSEFESRLAACGYTLGTRVSHLWVMAHLSRWLQGRQWGVLDLTGARVDEFFCERRAAGYASLCSRASMALLLEVLVSHGARLGEEPTEPASDVDALLARFSRFLGEERGLASSTAAAYVLRARRFLTECIGDTPLHKVGTAQVTRAVLRESAAVSAGSAQFFVVALRSFLRYCHLAGLIETDLSAAAMPVTGRRHSRLPRGISRADARALLHACDRRTTVGRRDYAVILTVLRLGLRANEVAVLELGDVDWRAGQIMVHGKGRRVDLLPLPADVGEAIAGYLRHPRPPTPRREVFLTAIAPRTGLSRTGVSCIVRRACVRAGIGPVGAHRLRHSLACEMVRAGVPLPEIGQVLRHHHGTSTLIYARVDVDQLRTIARAWPQEGLR